MTRRVLSRAVVTGWAALAAAGCGGGGPDRKPLEGAVTYNGKPVAYGSVMFNPDRSKGHSGVQGSADIRDGRYKTLPKMGPGVGPHVAVVTGFDAVADAGPDTPPLFADVKIPIEVTDGSRQIDIEVPTQRPAKK